MSRAIRQLGEELLGHSINPHRVRHTLATTRLWPDLGPLKVAATALSHRDTSMVAEFHDRSGDAAAVGTWRSITAHLMPAPKAH